MQKILDFDTNYELVVKDETLKGILFQMKPLKDVAGVSTVCDIADLNKIAIDIILKRNGGREIRLFEGYLEDYLLGLYAQNTKFELCKKKTTEGYLVFLDFTPSKMKLNPGDELVVRFKAQKTAFTGTNTGMSKIEFQTMPDIGESHYLPQVISSPIGKDEMNIDKDLGDDIVKIVVATDYTTDYLTSEEAKLVNGDIRANNFEKPFTEPQLLAENMHYFDNNPESDVQDLVAYWGEPLKRVKLRGKLDKPATIQAKILTLGLVNAR